MKHTKIRFATVLLAMWLLFTAIPITVFAELLQLHTEPISNDTVYVLAEDNTKRTAFEKHYYCSNGTFVAVTYPEAVHYQNEQGDWIDVDLRMTDDRVAQAYRSQSGRFKTSFSKPGVRSDTSIMSDGGTTSNAPAVSIESGDYALSWSLVGEQPAKTSVSTYASNGGSAYLSASEQATVQVVGELKTATPAAAVQKLPITDPGAFELSSVANQVVYENIFGRDQNVSVRYSVSLNKIEEDIMITAPTDMTSFSMQVACGSLTPTLNDDNSVDFLDNDGDMVYHVSIPYLVDSACAVSYAVDVTLTVQGESCIITYTPDAAWMQDPARVYPIMLDPAVTTRDYASAISDTYVESTSQVCHLNEQYLRISQDDRAKRVALLKLNHLPSIAENLPIISATLNTCSLMALNHSVVIDVKLEELASDLNLLMVKYNDLNGIGKTEIDRVSLSSTSAVTTFDITSCINNLYSGQSSGCFAISLVGNGYLLSIPPIYSTEQAVVSLRPYVSVTYGYVLPENLSANDSIQLKNLSSGGFLFPNSGLCGAGNYIMHAPDSAALNLRTFNLRVSTVSGAYKLELSPNSDTSNVFVSADLSSKLVLLKNASDASANIMQDWLIVPYDATTFKIVLASDMRYVMTAVGSATTYAATPSTSTGGCVSITQCNGAPTNAQLWKIFKGGQAVTNSMALPSLLIDSGIYYVNNRKTGAFISRNLTSSSVTMTSGLLEDIKDQIEWKITRLPDGYYTIQSTQHPNKFLTAQSESAIMATCTGEIEDAQKWHISGSDSQCFFKSALNDKYLYPSSDAATSSQYDLQIGYLNLASEWRMATPENYVELDEFLFSDTIIVAGANKNAQISSVYPTNSYWANDNSDFEFYVDSSNNESSVSLSGFISSQYEGETVIKVKHKVTGVESFFDIYTVVTFASEFTTTEVVDVFDVSHTDDGFYLLEVPLSSVLTDYGITMLYDGEYEDSQTDVNAFYDDWYLYAVVDNDQNYNYGLLKMREQEYDDVDNMADNDTPGVTIPFIEFNYTILLNCLNDATVANQQALSSEIQRVTLTEGSNIHSIPITEYFARTESFAPYLIAQTYVEKIAAGAINGKLSNLTAFAACMEENGQYEQRIREAINANNERAGKIICDLDSFELSIEDPAELTIYEKYAILLTHTANPSFNSFAAEVEYHAEKTLANFMYAHAVRADMTIEKNDYYYYYVSDTYYDYDGAMVVAQREEHGDQ
ncbi:MAG: hypothetical protein E7581_03900 [Ruminococcaceae bacterium]|nr:hypothetical protein [Oscillospiraceae bacterium]